MKYVVGRRGSKNPAEVGFFTPYYYINGNNKLEYIGNNERQVLFPNKASVIITREYYRLVNSFSSTEFFLLEIETSSQYEETIPASVKYQSYDGNSTTAEKLPLLIKHPFSVDESIKLPYADHPYVFIEDSDYIYGPISIYQNGKDPESDWFEYSIAPLNTVDLEIGDNFASVIFKYRKLDLEGNIVENLYGYENDKEYYIYGTKFLVQNVKPEEYILNETEEQIIEWAYSAFPEGYSGDKFDQWLTSNDGKDEVSKIRLEKLTALRHKTSSWLSFLDSFITTKFINSEEGKERVNQYIINNKDDLLREFETQSRKTINDQLKDEQENLNTLKQTQSLEREKLEALKVEIVKISEERELLYAKSQDLKDIENQISEKKSELKDLIDLQNIHEEYQRWQHTLYVLKNDVSKHEERLSELKKEYINVAKEGTHQKVVELMPYVKALSGYIPEDAKAAEKWELSETLMSRMRSEQIDLDQYFSSAKEFLSQNRRDLSEIDVANILTCIHQNFLTVLAGLPGVGKSSLSKLLSIFMTPEDLSLEVPVGRGWNSRKNLLGFYNSLKADYQNDEFGFLERLRCIESNEEYLKCLPLLVSLDEANLSPIEHYWSDFLGVSDNEFDKIIHVNDQKNNGKIRLPDGLRFLFTINNDHTTELLSPRLLDRGAIIKLDYDPHKSIDITFSTASLTNDRPFYSFGSIRNTFLPENSMLNQAEKRMLTDIVNILADKDVKLGNQIPVSPRKWKAINLYCTVIRKYMSRFQDNQFLALDYAILQNIIPLISGTGRGFEARLEKLKGECMKRNLFKSAGELDSILIRGKEFQNYSFF